MFFLLIAKNYLQKTLKKYYFYYINFLEQERLYLLKIFFFFLIWLSAQNIHKLNTIDNIHGFYNH
jgi:hypothetical protein